MIRLRDFIQLLQEQEKLHGNIECSVTVSDGPEGVGEALSSAGNPDFDFIPDPSNGDWLDIVFSTAERIERETGKRVS